MKITRVILFAVLIFLMAISTGFAIFAFKGGTMLNPKNLIILGTWIMIFALWGLTKNP
ncbi:MAG: hypothetical protein GTO08_05620 [Deltaproteobacteria bacterium]|nr:hypothetical protein [Deltaproteobacteria bacterium]